MTAVLTDAQRPFIWEFFRPGSRTVPRPGFNRGYYDEVIPIKFPSDGQSHQAFE